jgi:hypothetical protein
VPSGVRWSAVVAGAAVAWALDWMRGPFLHLVGMHLGVLGGQGIAQLATLLVGLAGGATAAHLAGRKAALHGALALALKVLVVLGWALVRRAMHGHFSFAVYTGSYLYHAAWIVFLGYLGGVCVAVRTGERVPSNASVDRRAVVLGAAVATGILLGFGVGSGIMWLVGMLVIGPVLLVGGAVAGALAARRGGWHGALAGVLASAIVIVLAAISLGRFLPQMLATPSTWSRMLLSTAIAIAAGSIGGWVATRSLARSPA